MNNLENNLQQINAKYVKLQNDEKTKNNNLLEKVLQWLLNEMKSNALFNALYSRQPCYAGSYYDGLKVSKPNEYDIDILLDLPVLSKPDLRLSTKAGYVSVSITLDEINKQSYLANYRGLQKLVDNSNYLTINKVNQWFEGLVQKAVTNISDKVNIKMKRSGPAVTVRVYPDYFEYFDIDLVPCFYFESNAWPFGYKSNPSNDGFFIVPKPLPNGNVQMWRASFQLQEKKLIKDIGKIKPALRLIKVLRDKENFPLKSYFIKTVFLWELEDIYKQEYFKSKSLSFTFLEMLEKLQYNISNYTIKFYWQKEYNLLENWSNIQCDNVASRLRGIIKKIKSDPKNVWLFYGSPVLIPSSSEIEGQGEQQVASSGINWGTVAGITAGIGALAFVGACVMNRKRND